MFRLKDGRCYRSLSPYYADLGGEWTVFRCIEGTKLSD